MAQKYVLPELDYDYSALEPFISGEIMELHHSKHHAGYVTGANAALAALEEARKSGDAADKVATISKNLAFNLGGHINHSLFWKNLAPAQDARPEGELAAAIDDEFGSFEQFQKEFAATGATFFNPRPCTPTNWRSTRRKTSTQWGPSSSSRTSSSDGIPK